MSQEIANLASELRETCGRMTNLCERAADALDNLSQAHAWMMADRNGVIQERNDVTRKLYAAEAALKAAHHALTATDNLRATDQTPAEFAAKVDSGIDPSALEWEIDNGPELALVERALAAFSRGRPKRTMCLDLTDEEMAALEKLAKEKELSPPAVFRQALKLYQLEAAGLAVVSHVHATAERHATPVPELGGSKRESVEDAERTNNYSKDPS